MEIVIKDEKWPKTLFEDEEPREEGLHLGEVIKSLMDNAGIGYSNKGGGFSDMELTAEIGLLWERVLSKVMREKYAIRPPQIKIDGIWMSPDGINTVSNLNAMSIGPDVLGEVPFVVEEYKASWRSSKNPPTDNFYYMSQLKSYCYALETNVSVMRIFHIMGDYRGSGPIYRVARIIFSQYELEQNWNMIIKEKERMNHVSRQDEE